GGLPRLYAGAPPLHLPERSGAEVVRARSAHRDAAEAAQEAAQARAVGAEISTDERDLGDRLGPLEPEAEAGAAVASHPAAESQRQAVLQNAPLGGWGTSRKLAHGRLQRGACKCAWFLDGNRACRLR